MENTRIPAPKNITELGGYINLLTQLGQEALVRDLVAAALGLEAPAAVPSAAS